MDFNFNLIWTHFLSLTVNPLTLSLSLFICVFFCFLAHLTFCLLFAVEIHSFWVLFFFLLAVMMQISWFLFHSNAYFRLFLFTFNLAILFKITIRVITCIKCNFFPFINFVFPPLFRGSLMLLNIIPLFFGPLHPLSFCTLVPGVFFLSRHSNVLYLDEI